MNLSRPRTEWTEPCRECPKDDLRPRLKVCKGCWYVPLFVARGSPKAHNYWCPSATQSFSQQHHNAAFRQHKTGDTGTSKIPGLLALAQFCGAWKGTFQSWACGALDLGNHPNRRPDSHTWVLLGPGCMHSQLADYGYGLAFFWR